MTVYVDDMLRQFGGFLMSHMMADTDEELHAMATLIGLKRSWWQPPNKGGSHYDISQTMKAKAIQHGAVSVTQRQLAAMNARRKVLDSLGNPDDAIEWLRGYAVARKGD
ncbi:MAG: hypothetical protein BWK73_09085 [Thiothrix lacustris]|uniref:DUF4031 domain-containing protein n=1 Tax=Thiothrix lacustris TaxID=525917 RepID=A0A1Y1QVU3_9GAMM|nr:MAG: hypothetical protein BWK73_09085 [Thiothrix lacustris]